MRRHQRSNCQLAVILMLMAGPAVAAAERPQLAPVRQAENWSALADPALRTGPLDHLKHLPLGPAGRFLTLGADLRLMQEIYHDEQWGAGRPGTAGSLLLRTLVHADLRRSSAAPTSTAATADRAPTTGRRCTSTAASWRSAPRTRPAAACSCAWAAWSCSMDPAGR